MPASAHVPDGCSASTPTLLHPGHRAYCSVAQTRMPRQQALQVHRATCVQHSLAVQPSWLVSGGTASIHTTRARHCGAGTNQSNSPNSVQNMGKATPQCTCRCYMHRDKQLANTAAKWTSSTTGSQEPPQQSLPASKPQHLLSQSRLHQHTTQQKCGQSLALSRVIGALTSSYQRTECVTQPLAVHTVTAEYEVDNGASAQHEQQQQAAAGAKLLPFEYAL